MTDQPNLDIRTERAVIAGVRQAVVAYGPDVVSFLQGQLSQDVEQLAPGDAGWSLVLHPQGKISAWFRIARVDHERFVFDVDSGWADEIVSRLNRFKLRTAVSIELAAWDSLTIVGPGADDVAVSGVEHDMISSWAGVPVRDVFGAQVRIDDELPELAPGAFEALRIEAGVPKMGVELDESTIPAAAGIVDRSVSFTKGCYTGQELVARIDSRGNNVPKRLLSLVLDGESVPTSGADVESAEGSLGTVTSAAFSHALGVPVALAYIKRAGEVGQSVTVQTPAGPAEAYIRDLPLIRG